MEASQRVVMEQGYALDREVDSNRLMMSEEQNDNQEQQGGEPEVGEEEEEEDDDAFYENPEELIREFGNNPLMEAGQQALLKQYKETQYRQQIVLLEKKDELRKLIGDRETIGVQLYSLQQQLARIQLMLENAHNEYNAIVDIRLSEEEILKEVNKNNSEQVALYDEYKKQQKKHAAELEALNETIRQIEVYNQQVASEIAISRRATYKVEQNMQDLEKQKEAQDSYVDSLSRQIAHLQEQIDFATKQYELQAKDTGEAVAILQTTIAELDLIGLEKQQLMLQWKAALSGLSRRDEALAQATMTLQTAESAVHDYDVEIEATRREIQREQGKHEALVSLRDRMENELSWVEESLLKLRTERAMLSERYSLLTKSLTQTETENKKLALVRKQLAHDSEVVVSNLQVVTQERQLLEEELTLLLSTFANVHKALSNLTKDQAKVWKQMHGKENESAEIEHTIAKLVVDRLTATTANEQLREALDKAGQEVSDKEALAAKYQLEIRQRNDEIEKKMYRVDRLNKKYEKLVESAGGGEEANLGPLENTIKKLGKEIEALTSECSELEREWLRRQTDLVALSVDRDRLQRANNEQQARLTVLTQQQLRLVTDLAQLHTASKAAHHLHADYNKDVSKLNGLISQNHLLEHDLQAQNFLVEMDCLEELKESETACFVTAQAIQENKASKGSLLEEIIQMERQAMLWEKKMQLDTETRQALDPTVGKAENETMEKEIHRMELRLEALRREQERLSQEMVRAIEKRSTIETRYATGKTTSDGGVGGGSGGLGLGGGGKGGMSAVGGAAASFTSKTNVKELTLASAKKKIGALKKESRILAEEIASYSHAFDEKKQALSEMTFELEKRTAQYGEAEEQCHQLQANINDLLYQKQYLQERISYRQKYCSRLREVSQQGVELGQALNVERKLLSSVQALDNVKEIIEELQSSFPHLKEVLERVLAMTDPGVEELKPTMPPLLQLNEQ